MVVSFLVFPRKGLYVALGVRELKLTRLAGLLSARNELLCLAQSLIFFAVHSISQYQHLHLLPLSSEKGELPPPSTTSLWHIKALQDQAHPPTPRPTQGDRIHRQSTGSETVPSLVVGVEVEVPGLPRIPERESKAYYSACIKFCIFQ